MYYISNQNNQIIAIDPSLSNLLGVEDIDELYKEIVLGNTKFSLSLEEDKVTITTAVNEDTYNIQKHDLSSMLGEITLIQVQMPAEDDILSKDVLLDDILTIDIEEKNDIEPMDDLFDIETPEEENVSILDDILNEIAEEETQEEDSLLENLLNIETNEKEEVSLLDDDTSEESNELFDLIMPSEDKESIAEISQDIIEEEPVADIDESQDPIVIDINTISQSIGISTEDYDTFLNEYIDTALSLEKDLQSTQEEVNSHAIDTLSHLSNVLHLPVISEIIIKIKDATADSKDKYIVSFYATLARLTTTQLETSKEETKIEIAEEKEIETPIETPIEIAVEEEPEEEPAPPVPDGFGTIDLSEVKAIHFDFQIEQAANDLSLPVELIEEFVHDFITQARTETDKMLAAYERGDLKTIQEIGHLLKGTSSNLRIDPLADTLYEIQFCEDGSKLENMIKLYWGHFLSLETQINITTK